MVTVEAVYIYTLQSSIYVLNDVEAVISCGERVIVVAPAAVVIVKLVNCGKLC